MKFNWMHHDFLPETFCLLWLRRLPGIGHENRTAAYLCKVVPFHTTGMIKKKCTAIGLVEATFAKQLFCL